eukprot:TRINITY_DN23880_c0_g1_i1.p1 TRINITY_DN23880_c0_g1~~TRINITY_DN23880_c0_g1_i1.p1  ORF type:complete len:275 (-),score=52.04 TRINITY_DN23880_c0_g1_i1:124-948(-)
MFTLVLIEDDVSVKPAHFRHCEIQLKKEIQSRYIDRVIPNVGLCVEFYEFVRIRDAPIYPGDAKLSCGEAVFSVEFHLVVFRPAIDEWIVGTVSGSTTFGLRVSLGFFEDISIPSSNLRSPHAFDAGRRTWAWEYRSEDTREVINFFYDIGELVRFRVTQVVFPEPQGPDTASKISAMSIVGAMDRDGLGCNCWWPSMPIPPPADAEPAPIADADAAPPARKRGRRGRGGRGGGSDVVAAIADNAGGSDSVAVGGGGGQGDGNGNVGGGGVGTS